MKSIAGHQMTDTIHGLACLTCGRRFADIAGASRDDLHKPHIAHEGNLIERELHEIQAEVARVWGLLVGVATGGGPVEATNGESG